MYVILAENKNGEKGHVSKGVIQQGGKPTIYLTADKGAKVRKTLTTSITSEWIIDIVRLCSAPASRVGTYD